MPEALYKKGLLAQVSFYDPSYIFFSFPLNFRLNILHTFENIGKTLSVALEVLLSIYEIMISL